MHNLLELSFRIAAAKICNYSLNKQVYIVVLQRVITIKNTTFADNPTESAWQIRVLPDGKTDVQWSTRKHGIRRDLPDG
jgi:hypothetical protein